MSKACVAQTAAFEQSAVTPHRVAAFCFAPRLPLFAISRVLVRLDHVVSIVVQADHFVVAVRSAKAVESAA
jgi:hypothetical protein